MDYRLVVGVVVALIVGLAIGYGVHSTTTKPVVTTEAKPEIVTITKTITSTIAETLTTTTTAERTITISTTTPVTVTKTTTVKTPVAIVDALGRIVEFNKTPRRVVSLAPSITEILFTLGLGDSVVGVDKYSNYPPEVVKLVEEGRIKVIGGYWNPDLEKILELKPDLVLASAGVPSHLQLLEKFNELGLRVVYLKAGSAQNVYDVYRDIRLVAKIFGVEQHAEEVISRIEEEISSVSSKLAEVNATPVKVLILLGPPTWGLWTAGGGTFIDYVIGAAGGVNIAGRYSGWVQLSYEDIVSADPDVIIITAMGVNPRDVLSEIAGTPLNQTSAFRNGNIYVFTGEADDLLSRPGPRIGDAVVLVAKTLHPDVLGEVGREDVVKLGSQQAMGAIIPLLVHGVDVEV